MYPGNDRCIRRYPGLEVVLCFVVVPIGQVVEGQVEFDSTPNLLRYAHIKNGMAGRDDRGVFAIKPIVIDGAHS